MKSPTHRCRWLAADADEAPWPLTAMALVAMLRFPAARAVAAGCGPALMPAGAARLIARDILKGQEWTVAANPAALGDAGRALIQDMTDHANVFGDDEAWAVGIVRQLAEARFKPLVLDELEAAAAAIARGESPAWVRAGLVAAFEVAEGRREPTYAAPAEVHARDARQGVAA